MPDKPDVFAELAAKEAKLNRAFYEKENTLKLLDIAASMGNPNFDPELAASVAKDWTRSKMDDNNRRKSGKQQGATFDDWATARINKKPSLVGLGNGAEAADIDKGKLFSAMNGNATDLAQLVKLHGLPKMNAAARAGGKADIFDKRTPYRPAGYTARAGEVPAKPDVSSGEINPFVPGPHFNLTAQARVWTSDPTRAKKLMEKAGVTQLGMTQKQIRGGR